MLRISTGTSDHLGCVQDARLVASNAPSFCLWLQVDILACIITVIFVDQQKKPRETEIYGSS